MPDQLTETASRASTPSAGRTPERGALGRLVGGVVGRVVGQVLAIVVLFALAGVAAAGVWHLLWSPATGVVAEGRWLTDEDGLRDAFSGTGTYVLVAVVTGFLVGALASFVLDRSEVATLAAVLVGATLAGWLMLRLGLSWGPADPEVLARTAEDGTELPAQLTVDLPYAWLALPGAALLGMVVVFLTTTKRDLPDA